MQKVMDLQDVQLTVEPYLAKLSAMKNANEIADFFIGEQIQAIPGNALACAIAEYLSEQTGFTVRVDRDGIAVMHPQGDVKMSTVESGFVYDTQFVKVGTQTDAMKSFMRRFDACCYPELISGEED
jgi:hypothetical protein